MSHREERPGGVRVTDEDGAQCSTPTSYVLVAQVIPVLLLAIGLQQGPTTWLKPVHLKFPRAWERRIIESGKRLERDDPAKLEASIARLERFVETTRDVIRILYAGIILWLFFAEALALAEVAGVGAPAGRGTGYFIFWGAVVGMAALVGPIIASAWAEDEPTDPSGAPPKTPPN